MSPSWSPSRQMKEKEADISFFGEYFPGIFQLGPLIQIPEMVSGTKLVNHTCLTISSCGMLPEHGFSLSHHGSFQLESSYDNCFVSPSSLPLCTAGWDLVVASFSSHLSGIVPGIILSPHWCLRVIFLTCLWSPLFVFLLFLCEGSTSFCLPSLCFYQLFVCGILSGLHFVSQLVLAGS